MDRIYQSLDADALHQSLALLRDELLSRTKSGRSQMSIWVRSGLAANLDLSSEERINSVPNKRTDHKKGKP